MKYIKNTGLIVFCVFFLLSLVFIINITFANPGEPAITISSPTNTTYVTTSLELNWSSNETFDWAGYELNGATNVSINMPLNTTLTDGTDWMLSIYADNYFVYGGSKDTNVYVWNKADMSLNATLTAGTNDIEGVFADDDFIYGASGDTKIYVWNRALMNLNTTLTDGTIWMTSVFADNEFIYAGSGDYKIYIWNRTNLSLHTSLSVGTNYMDSVYVDDDFIYGGNRDSNVYVWNRTNMTIHTNLTDGTSLMYSVYADDDFIYGANWDNNIYVWNKTNMSLHTTLSSTDEWWSVYSDKNRIYGGNDDNKLYVYDKINMNLITTLTDGTDDIRSVYVDSGFVYGVSKDNKTYIWNNYFNTTITVTEGSNTLYVWANDSVGNMNYSKVVFFVDSINPNIVFMQISNNSYNNTGIMINVSFNDTNINDTFWSNDSWVTNYTTFNISTTGWLEQEHLIWVFANDTINNINITTLNITLDDTFPIITFVYPSNETYNKSGVIIQISISDIHLDTTLWSKDDWTTNNTILIDADEGSLSYVWDFSVDGDGGVATIDGTYFWIPDDIVDAVKVDKYNTTGDKLDSWTITNPADQAVGGITALDNDTFRIIDSFLDVIHNYNGTFEDETSYSVDGTYSNHGIGITAITASYNYIVDDIDDKVYKFDRYGVWQAEWDISAYSDKAAGLATDDGTYFYVYDWQKDMIFKFSSSFSHIKNLTIPTSIGNVKGIDVVGDYFYLQDGENNKLWKLRIPDISINISTSGWSDGEYEVLVFANDSAANVNTSAFNITIDNLGPGFSNNKTNATVNEDQDLEINITVIDAGVGVDTVYLEFTNNTHTINYTMLNVGSEYYLGINQDNYTAHDNISWYFYAKDSLDNLNRSPVYYITVDNQLPTHSTPILNSTTDTNVTSNHLTCWNVSTSDTDAEDIVYNIIRWYNDSVRKDILENFTTIISGNTTKNDIWWCEIIPFDGYSNGSSANSTNITIQNSGPTTPIHSSPADGFVSGSNTITLIWSASTDNDTDSLTYYIYIDDVLNTSVTGTSKSLWFADGTYYWNLTADDGTINSSRSSDWYFTVDVSYPIVYLTTPIDDFNSTNQTQFFNVSFTDVIGLANTTLYIWNSTQEVNNTFENITTTANESNISVVLPDIGIYYWNHYTCDSDDKCTWGIVNFTMTIDQTAPTITFVEPTNNSYANSGIIINVSFYDPRLNESLFSNDSWITNYTTFNISTAGWGEQEHLIYVFVNDTLNNVNTSTFNITIDDTVPTYRSITYLSSITEGETQTFTVNATDTNIDSVWVEIYNGETSARSNHSMSLISNDTYSWGGTWAVTADRTFNFTIYINDSAENLNSSTETSYTVNVYVAPTPPSGGGSAPPAKAVAVCGNGICEVGEDIENCPEDCLPVENITLWLSPEYATIGGVLDFEFYETIFIMNPTPYNLSVLVQVQCVEDDPGCNWLYLIDEEGNLTQEMIVEAVEGSEKKPGRKEINMVLITPSEMAYGEYRANLLFTVSGFKRAFSIDISYQPFWELFYGFIYTMGAPVPAFPKPFMGVKGIPVAFWIGLIIIIMIALYIGRSQVKTYYRRWRYV